MQCSDMLHALGINACSILQQQQTAASSTPYDVEAMLEKRARTHTASALSAAARRHVSHLYDSVTNSSSASASSSATSVSSVQDKQQQQDRVLAVTLSSEPTVTSPLVCIALGDSLLFDISAGCYPVYQRDSLLNSNPHFDYGAFRDLATHMTAAAATGSNSSSSALYTTFGFAFTAPGSYVFSSSCDPAVKSSTGSSSGTVTAAAVSSLAVVAVMRADTACTTPAQFVPLTTSALVSLGIAKQDKGLTLTPDWSLIGGLLVSLRRVTFAVLNALTA
jgi:hypothetical protein